MPEGLTNYITAVHGYPVGQPQLRCGNTALRRPHTTFYVYTTAESAACACQCGLCRLRTAQIGNRLANWHAADTICGCCAGSGWIGFVFIPAAAMQLLVVTRHGGCKWWQQTEGFVY